MTSLADRLTAARTEWQRQMNVEKAATSGPWSSFCMNADEAWDIRDSAGRKWRHIIARLVSHDSREVERTAIDGFLTKGDGQLIALARNLTPARLAVVDELLQRGGEDDSLELAERLLGIEAT